MREPAGVGTLIGMLQAALLLHRGRVGQMHPVVCLHQPIDEPVPVVRRLHHHARDLCVIGRQLIQNRREMIGSTLVVHHLVLLIAYHDHTIICMEVDPCVEWHAGLLLLG